MPNSNQDKGFAHLIAILVFGLGGLLVISSAMPISRNYNDGKSSVAGVYLAKGGDDSGSSEKLKNEIRQGNLRIKFEKEHDKVKVETKVKQSENETELEQEAKNETVKEVKAELEKEDIKIATAPTDM